MPNHMESFPKCSFSTMETHKPRKLGVGVRREDNKHMCMVHTESLDTFTYVHVRTYVGIHNIHTYKAHHVRTNVQLNLLNVILYGQFHNSMLKALHVDSTHIMRVYIS